MAAADPNISCHPTCFFPDKSGMLCLSYPTYSSLVTSDVSGSEGDRISRLPDKLLSNAVARLPLKDAARTAVLSSRWCGVWGSTVNGGVEDRISHLPDKLLSNIVARLPLKDAARTAVLSSRWCGVWASTPLVLDDADLLPVLSDGRGFSTHWRTITDTVSSILAAHPGPFLSVRLTHIFHHAVFHEVNLARDLLRILIDKDVASLGLFNLTSATSTSLPVELFSITSVRRMYLSHWYLPSTDVFCLGTVVFPHLRQLWLRQIQLNAVDIDRLLQFSPALEVFALISCHSSPPNIRIRSRNLQCVIHWMSVASRLEVIVVPKLKRLILWSKSHDGQLVDDSPTKVTICYVPELKVLGYLDPRFHVLEIGTTFIEAETKPNPSTVVPSVRILALNVRFDVLKEAQMVPSFLRCFPLIETLHVKSDGDGDEESIDLSVKFWLEGSPIRCLRSTLRKLIFKNFRGHATELQFLRFIWERAKVLEKLVIGFAGGDDPIVLKEVFDIVRSQVLANRVFPDRKASLVLRTRGGRWSLNRASDPTLSDPFDF